MRHISEFLTDGMQGVFGAAERSMGSGDPTHTPDDDRAAGAHADALMGISEATEERVAIKVDSGMPEASAIDQTRKEMASCEVKMVLRTCYPDSCKAKAYFDLVGKRRGHAAAEALKDACREAWMKKSEEDRQKKS